MVCHHLDKSIPEDIAFADSRIRSETVAAEDVLQDTGAISMISSDCQAMGRIGEVITRTWRTAAKMKQFRGPLEGDEPTRDNNRVKRYVAKYTINPAITHGMSHLIGQVAVGCLADLVFWTAESFGARPEMILKGGVIAWAAMGDANASIPTVQPSLAGPCGALSLRPLHSIQLFGSARHLLTRVGLFFPCYLQMNMADELLDLVKRFNIKKRAEAVKNCRAIGKKDMKWNDSMPKMTGE